MEGGANSWQPNLVVVGVGKYGGGCGGGDDGGGGGGGGGGGVCG